MIELLTKSGIWSILIENIKYKDVLRAHIL